MPILVTCKCGKKFRADEKHAGKQKPCPKCGQALDIAGPHVSAYDVFVSYSSKDKTTCDALVATFERKGMRCWIAPRDILPGVNWGEAIIGGIEQCRAMVLVFSAHSNESPQVKREVERAVSKGIPVIPLRIEDVKLSRAMEYFISSQHWLDALTPPLENHLEELARKVMRFLSDDGSSAMGPGRSGPETIPQAIPVGEWTPPAPDPFSLEHPSSGPVWPASPVVNDPAPLRPNYLLPRPSPRTMWTRIPLVWRWIAVGGAAALFILLIFNFLRPSGLGTIKIDIPSSYANLTVKIDGETINPPQLNNPLRLKVGEHRLEVAGKDIEPDNKSFMVRKGDNPELKIVLVSKPHPAESSPAAAKTQASEPEGNVVHKNSPVEAQVGKSKTSDVAAAQPKTVTAPSSQLVKEDAPASDLAAMQGVWSVVAEEFGGVATSPEELGPMRTTLTVISNSFVIERFKNGKPQKRVGTIQLVPNSSPKQFNWSGTSWDGTSAELLGIYELSSDTLRIVYDWQNKESNISRPTKFSSALGTSINVVTFQRTAAASEAEWTDLFNGRDFASWVRLSDGSTVTSGWRVEGGAIHMVPSGGGDIRSTANFDDFELEFDWKISIGGNSGVLYRVGDEPATSNQLEYQILDDDLHVNGKDAITSAGSIFAVDGRRSKALNPVGQWNTAKIIARGNHLEHWLNGSKVAEADIGSEFWNRNVTQRPFAKEPQFGKSSAGHIVLQDHGNEAWFRKMRIRKLTADVANLPTPDVSANSGSLAEADWIDLINAKDLKGWTPVASKGAWSQKDGIITATPGDGWLATDRDYGDFELELEYKLPPKGNSGVFLRAPLEGASSGAGLLEVQAIDDNAFRNEPDHNRTGAVWGLFGGKPRADAPTNKWNKLSIRAVGPRITVVVNGTKVTEGNLADEPEAALKPNMKLPTGRIGLQRRAATGVEFRNIRIRELNANE